MTGRRPSILLPLSACSRRDHPPLAEPGDPAVPGHFCRQEAGLSHGLARGPTDKAHVPRGEDGLPRDPMSFDCEFDVPLRRRRIQQIGPKGIVADERRAERVLMVLGILGKERYPAVTVEVGPCPAV